MTGAIGWLADPSNWTGSDGILTRLAQHLWYVLLSLGIAAVIALPLGALIGHTGRGTGLVSGLANALRALPSLGLLIMLALWGLNNLPGSLSLLGPTIAVLVILAVPPILSNTYAGIAAVDPAARDAARGMGMTGSQVLWRVEFPVALPLIMSGLRSAYLQVVATATIAAVVSLGGFGRYVIDGLAQQDYSMMVGGAILVALLAIIGDRLLALIGHFAISPGITGRSVRGRATTADLVVQRNPGAMAAAEAQGDVDRDTAEPAMVRATQIADRTGPL
jgi:osmoprotectant transport system permease protein